MGETLKLGCVVLAAGSARRFGGNKLTAALSGKSLIQRALEAVPTEVVDAAAVVTQYPEAANFAKEYGFTAIQNDRPALGISHSLQLGLAALGDCDGVLFQVADQPLLLRETVAGLAALWKRQPDCIAALGHGGVRGNPCLFPARLFPELMALGGGLRRQRRHPTARSGIWCCWKQIPRNYMMSTQQRHWSCYGNGWSHSGADAPLLHFRA